MLFSVGAVLHPSKSSTLLFTTTPFRRRVFSPFLRCLDPGKDFFTIFHGFSHAFPHDFPRISSSFRESELLERPLTYVRPEITP